MDPKTKLQSQSMTSTAARLTLFDQPPLLEGEDPADYDQLLARVCAVVKPVDIVDEIFVSEIVCLEWEVLRWRRLKWTLMRATGLNALQRFLVDQLESNYALHDEQFKSYLADFFHNNLPKGPAEYARKAKELVQDYLRREPKVVTLVSELLSNAGTSIEALTVKALNRDFDYIERIDRLTAIAESRRNASLREIDRRRAVLGETLRRSVQEVEDAEFKVIGTTPAKGKDAA